MALARRGSLMGLLFWPGALLYTLYNYIAYAVAMPLTVQFVAYLALVILCVSTIFFLVTNIDALVIQERLGGAVAERFGGGCWLG